MKGVAVFRFAGAAISELQVFGDMANLIKPASSVEKTEAGNGKETADQAAASADLISVRDIWLAGLGAVAAAEEHGTRLVRSLIERGETWEPVVRTSTARAGETIGRAASTATAAAREIGKRVKSAASTGEATVVQFVKSLTERSPARQELDTLKRRVDALAARLESEETTASTSRSQLAQKG